MNIILLHGMSCRLEDCWRNYVLNIGKELNIDVLTPACPLKEEITLSNWFEELDKYKRFINQETIFICHSLSTNFVVRYLAKNKIKAKALIAVAGGLASKERMQYLKDFVFTTAEAQYVVDNIKFKYNIYGDNDDTWTKQEIKNYCNALKTKEIVMHDAGHLGRRSGVKEIPAIKKLIKKLQCDCCKY